MTLWLRLWALVSIDSNSFCAEAQIDVSIAAALASHQMVKAEWNKCPGVKVRHATDSI